MPQIITTEVVSKAAASQTNSKTGFRDKPWECGACTVINMKPLALACEICGAERTTTVKVKDMSRPLGDVAIGKRVVGSGDHGERSARTRTGSAKGAQADSGGADARSFNGGGDRGITSAAAAEVEDGGIRIDINGVGGGGGGGGGDGGDGGGGGGGGGRGSGIGGGSSGDGAASGGGHSNMWACNVCSFTNSDPMTFSCEACGSARGTLAANGIATGGALGGSSVSRKIGTSI